MSLLAPSSLKPLEFSVLMDSVSGRVGMGMSTMRAQPSEEPGCGKGAREPQLNAETSGESKDHESETPDRAGSLSFHSYPVASPVLSHLCLHFVDLTPLGWPCPPQVCSVFRVAGPSPHCPSGPRARI